MKKVAEIRLPVGGIKLSRKEEKEERKKWRKIQAKEAEQQKRQLEAKAVCYGNFGRIEHGSPEYIGHTVTKWSVAFDRKFMKKCMTCPMSTMCSAFTLGIKAIEIGQSTRS